MAVFMNPLTSEEEVYDVQTVGTVGYPPEFRRARRSHGDRAEHHTVTKEVCNETDLSARWPGLHATSSRLSDDGDAFDTYIFIW